MKKSITRSKEDWLDWQNKTTAQERPYVSRPSRSQQLRNPKLVPKLTNETLNPLEKKSGVADAELAKVDAERARKREREERDNELIESTAKRHRSVSSHSVSTISTGASRSPSPEAKVEMTFEAEVAVSARIAVEALMLSLIVVDLCLAMVVFQKTMTAAISIDPVIPCPREEKVLLRSSQGELLQGLGVQMGTEANGPKVQGRQSLAEDGARDSIGLIHDLAVRDQHPAEDAIVRVYENEV
ncbi:hypothetical protein FLONG3_9244 [Fusarium longipes]|uniref:Uncharacterized protein n=1 Tax=Fusarium longipes TaxID=694270 RepID=A0A395RYX5_9HYPO|nr:hypothetical protein FLONG3_9244 [Fusarium longipes]